MALPALAAVTAWAALALIPMIASAAVLPPGNSAANQYTEAFPTQGGNTPAGDKSHGTPAKTLGKKNAKRLEAQGAEGRAAAEVAAATAPVAQSESKPPGGGSSIPPGATNTDAGGTTGDRPGSTHGSGGSSRPQGPNDASGGSSGFGEVLGQATGSSSSGQLGLLLPLLIAAAVIWSIAYALRSRQRPGGDL